ncbi:MAG: ribose-phosphate pyrophosphokinase [Candidatus Omnitrophica bacterium]|nr:ribose-phosphate pyrophosphokinase [Candidatus Omnitrophota bacterium]MCM8802444.1 ribose-phosphate pyrophosphokinase [Candidatus Omnitrophota bacterium]
MDSCLIFSGNSNLELSKKITAYLQKELSSIKIYRFQDGEICVKIEENIRGKDVFIIQSTCPPVNENLMELLIILDALRRASPRRITAVIPYYGYARQDRKDQPRVPITAKLVANLLVTAGANRILTMDLHAPQIQGFFDIPVDHLFAAPVIIKYLREKKFKNPVIVAPDVGSVKMARAFAKRLPGNLAIVDKRRESPEKVEMMHVIGEVKGCEAIIVDDLISTGNTMIEAGNALLKNGATEIYGCCTHPVLSGDAIEKFEKSLFKEIIITDTIYHSSLPSKFTILTVSELLGEAIKSIHLETTVSKLFI